MELNEKFWELRDSVVQCELLILRQLNFHVSFEHPHKVMHITYFFCISLNHLIVIINNCIVLIKYKSDFSTFCTTYCLCGVC